MNKIVELPLISPMYGTYQHQGTSTAILVDNPSIRNHILNQVLIPRCTRRFLSGYTCPELDILGASWRENPYLEKINYPMQFLGGHIHFVIRKLLDAGYYVFFHGIDDYYIKGKSWYKERHFGHDGAICGYNKEDKTYCIYAHDSNWIYRKFWTPQQGFEEGRVAMFKKGVYANICGLKPKPDQVEFSAETALKNIAEYLDSNLEKYPETEEGNVYGIAVNDYISKYIGKLLDGSIPYERKDRRIFRLIWEHKKVMLERIQCIEKKLEIGSDISEEYSPLIYEAETIRMIYASYVQKRRDTLLPTIQEKLISLKNQEERILSELIIKTENV